MGVLNSVIVLSVLGLLFGIGLGFASKKFAIKVDPKVEAIRNVLPGVNCGACGFPGCDGFAAACAKGQAPVNGCPVGGAPVASKVGEIMGSAAGDSRKMVARVKCQGTDAIALDKYKYFGVNDCKAANMVQGGPKTCSNGCLGLGTCVNVCEFGAIEIVNGIAKIDKDKCTGCKACIQACPKTVIELVPYDQKVFVDCNSKDRGKVVKDSCTLGCIGCGLCAKACPFDAITMINNLPVIDYDKCKNCKICAKKCPTGAITPHLKEAKVAE
jgi:electron transport complex protein RnfB